jgi:uncharacterized membrane protein YuzA (DUF378 family)
MMKGGCVGHKVSWVLVIVGALNWGLVGAADWNLVEALLGTWPLAVKIVYILVGLAGLMMLIGCKCKACKAMKK